jgi:hypothetical protein
MNKISQSKLILMEKKQAREVRSLVERAVRQELQTGRVDEGLWDSIKHGMAKLTSLRKMLPSSKRDAAQAQIDKILSRADAASNRAFAELNTKLKASGYPNQKDPEQFLAQTKEIGTIYDSIAASARSGELDVKIANDMIKDLRKVMQFFMDYELESVYKRLAEAEGDAGPAAAEPEGPLTGDFDTSAVKELRSKVAPMVLALGGIIGMLGGALMRTKWFFELITDVTWKEGLPQSVVTERVLDRIGPEAGEGVTQTLGRIFFGDVNHYGPNVKVSELLADMKTYGLTPQQLASLGTDPSSFSAVWSNLTSNPAATLAKAFGAKTPGGMEWTVDPSKVINIVDEVVSTVTVPVKKYTLRAGLSTIGTAALSKASILLPAIGVGLLVSGAAVYFLRKHGQKYSRLATLDGLLQIMKDIEPSEVTAAPGATAGAEAGAGSAGAAGAADSEGGEGGESGEGAGAAAGTGETIHIFRKGPHKHMARGRKINLVGKLTKAGLPNWAIQDVTKRIKQELEDKGFVVKEGMNLEELLEAKASDRSKEKASKAKDSRRVTPKTPGGRGGGADGSEPKSASHSDATMHGHTKDRDVGAAKRKELESVVTEFGQDTTVDTTKTRPKHASEKSGDPIEDKKPKTVPVKRKFKGPEIRRDPTEFLDALSKEEKLLLLRLPKNPNMEISKVDFFKMDTEERKDLYAQVRLGKTTFEKEFRIQPKPKELEKGKFFMTDLRDILETGHTAHDKRPIDPTVIRDAMEEISDYLSDYLGDAGIQMRESVELQRWSVLAGIKTVLRG